MPSMARRSGGAELASGEMTGLDSGIEGAAVDACATISGGERSEIEAERLDRCLQATEVCRPSLDRVEKCIRLGYEMYVAIFNRRFLPAPRRIGFTENAPPLFAQF